MSSRWEPAGGGGHVVQSSLPTAMRPVRPEGRNFRGVVTAVYTFDSTDGLEAFGNAAPTYNAIYCDVLCYGRWNGIFKRVLWTADRSGMHEGTIDLPRAATLDISGDLNVNISNPAAMDGDHVIVGFLDDDYSQPFIQRFIPHPSSDIGNDAKPIGNRMRVNEADGHPRFQKHRGAFWGVDDKGDFFIDLTLAHTGAYESDGKEPDPAEDGTSGSYTVRVQKGAKLKLQGPNLEVIEILADGTIRIVATNGEQEIIMEPSGTLTINCPKQESSIVLSDSGKILVIAGAGNKPHEINASSINLRGDTVNVGEGATEKAMLGDLWSSLHTSYDVALTAVLTAISIELGAPPPVPVASAISTFATAQAALTAGPLSGTVKVKT